MAVKPSTDQAARHVRFCDRALSSAANAMIAGWYCALVNAPFGPVI
jgi:hypothetical protein